MTIAIIVGALCGLIWFIAQHWGGSKVETVPDRRPPKRTIRTEDVPATWQGQALSDRYIQQIIDEDEEIPF